MQITKDTRIWDILLKYGDIADVMELFGIKRVRRYSLRMFPAKASRVIWLLLIIREGFSIPILVNSILQIEI